MKSFILAALAALTIAFTGYAAAASDMDRGNSTFPTGSIQYGPE